MLLIEDATLRATIAANAREVARLRYNEAASGDAWLTTIRGLARRPQALPNGTSSPRPSANAHFAATGRLGTHAMELARKAAHALQQGNYGAMGRRTADHAVNLAHLAAWGLRRRRRAAGPE